MAQQIVPFAAELAEPSRRGATIGTVMSGLLCGILFGRALAGAVGDHYGWRAMFWLGLLLTVAVGLLLAAVLPRSRPKTQVGYGALLKSLAILWRQEPELRRATMIQGCLFGSFSALWTILALQLDARYHLSAEIAGRSASSVRSACSLRLSPGRSQTGEVPIPSSDLAASSCSRPGWFLGRGA